jgi:hypothetical protein
LVRLGRSGEATPLIEEVLKTADELKGSYSQLVPELHLIKAELSFIHGDVSDAAASAEEAVRTAPQALELLLESRYFLGLVKAATGDRKNSKSLCEEAVNGSSNTGNVGLYSHAQFYCADAALRLNDAQLAASLAGQAQEKFARGGQLESEWRAWTIASRATEKLGDKDKAGEMQKNGENARSRLEQQWGPDAFKQYAARPDIQVYYR